MKYSKCETIFNAFSPLPLKAVMWLFIAFVTSAILNGWEFSLEYALFISVLVFNARLVVDVRNYFLYRNSLSRKGLVKVFISLGCFLLFNTILLLTTNWKYLIALFLIPLPVLIGLYFLYNQFKRKN